MNEELEDQGVPTTPRGSMIPEADRARQTMDLEAMDEPSPVVSPTDQHLNSVHISMSARDATPSLAAQDCETIPEDLELASGVAESNPAATTIGISQPDSTADAAMEDSQL